jgi:TorA maturation chaperone TorD
MNKNRKNLLKGYNLLLYFAGSMLMNEPTEECVIDFWKNGILKRLPVSSSNPRFIKAAGILRESCTDDKNCRKLLSEDYFRLFAETGLRLAPANALPYLRDEGEPGEKVSEFYNSYGWNSGMKVKIPDDHLGIELLFLTKLVDKYLVLDDDPCCCEMKKEIRRFMDQHILSWIPAWYKEVEEHAQSLCYKGIGLLIYACVEDLSGIFSRRDNPSR